MVTPDQFREIALALPEASEQPHWDMPSFRVGKKIFATLQPDARTVVLKIPVIEHEHLIESSRGAFERAAWGEQGWLRVNLGTVRRSDLVELVEEAWRSVAPKRAQRALDDPP